MLLLFILIRVQTYILNRGFIHSSPPRYLNTSGYFFLLLTNTYLEQEKEVLN